MEDNFRRIYYLLKLGDVERAKEEAEFMVREDPEDIYGYLSLSYVYFYGLHAIDIASEYIDEALQLDHLNEFVLLAGLDIFTAQSNWIRLREIAEIGIRNYPEEAPYYFYMGEAIRHLEGMKDVLVYLEKAMELDPENEMYVGRYAYIILKYSPKRKEEGLMAEKRALELNPENIANLFYFASIAKEKGNFKKARMLAETAMKLAPNDEDVRGIYKDTIVTKNKFCAFTMGFSQILVQAFSKFCSLFGFVYNLNQYVHTFLIALSFIGWLILPIYVIGWYAGIIYFVVLVMCLVSSIIKGKIYKEVGLSMPSDWRRNLRLNQSIRDREICNMTREVVKGETVNVSTQKLSPEEIESQLASFWGKEAVFEKQQAEEIEPTVDRPHLSSEEHKQIQSYSDIKSPRYNKWGIFLVIIFSVILIYRAEKLYNLYQRETGSTTPDISQETKQAIVKYQDRALEEQKEKFNKYAVESIVYSLKKSDFSENSLRQFVEAGYVPVVMGKVGQPSVEKLKNVHPAKFYKEGTITYVLLQDEESSFILAIRATKLSHIYGESWDNREREMQRYYEIIAKIDSQGIAAGTK
ncbi:tetratricopeptide repeat protein [Bacillus sp. C1]